VATTLEQVAAELYALPPDAFTAQRAARAKALRAEDGELAGAVARLPKPVLSAWAVNRFAQERPDDLEDLLGLGEQLREAQREHDADRVKALSGNAQALVRRTLKGVVAVAAGEGAALSEALLGQVEQTLRAAMADERAAAVLRAGVLAKPLEAAGFGPVDLEGAVAVIPAARAARARPQRLAVVRPVAGERRAAAEQEARQAQSRAEAAQAALEEQDEALASAEAAHADAVRRRDELREGLAEAEQQEQATARRAREARKQQERAAAKAERAREKAERARKAVDALG
jgi:hypothetical protein